MEETPSGFPVVNILMAINGADNTEFIEVSAYGDLAGLVCEYCIKSTLIHVVGTLRYKKEVSKIKVKAVHIQFISGLNPNSREN